MALDFGRREVEDFQVRNVSTAAQAVAPGAELSLATQRSTDVAGKFEIKKAKNGQFFFNLKAGNGEIILSSEMYTRKASAKNGIASVQANAGNSGRYDRRVNKGGKDYFVLKAANHQVFSGYREHGARARADEATTRLWKDAGARLLEYHLEKRFDYVAIGAQEEAAEEIGRSLHPYLERLHRATFVANPANMGGAALRSELVDLDMVVRRERQEALAGRVCDTAWGGGNAFLGLAAALEAANAQAIETLVVAGTFVRPGVVCSQCGHLSRTGDPCPVCGARLFPVDDVVAALMEAVISAGGTVHQIDVPSPLDVHGVGALTRFPVPV